MDNQRTDREGGESPLTRFAGKWKGILFFLLVCVLPEFLAIIVHPRSVSGIMACVLLFFLGGVVLWFAAVLAMGNVLHFLSKKKDPTT